MGKARKKEPDIRPYDLTKGAVSAPAEIKKSLEQNLDNFVRNLRKAWSRSLKVIANFDDQNSYPVRAGEFLETRADTSLAWRIHGPQGAVGLLWIDQQLAYSIIQLSLGGKNDEAEIPAGELDSATSLSVLGNILNNIVITGQLSFPTWTSQGPLGLSKGERPRLLPWRNAGQTLVVTEWHVNLGNLSGTLALALTR